MTEENPIRALVRKLIGVSRTECMATLREYYSTVFPYVEDADLQWLLDNTTALYMSWIKTGILEGLEDEALVDFVVQWESRLCLPDLNRHPNGLDVTAYDVVMGPDGEPKKAMQKQGDYRLPARTPTSAAVVEHRYWQLLEILAAIAGTEDRVRYLLRNHGDLSLLSTRYAMDSTTREGVRDIVLRAMGGAEVGKYGTKAQFEPDRPVSANSNFYIFNLMHALAGVSTVDQQAFLDSIGRTPPYSSFSIERLERVKGLATELLNEVRSAIADNNPEAPYNPTKED